MTVSRRATTAEPSRTGLSACQAVLKGAFPAAELVPGEEPEAGVVGFGVSNAEPDRVGGRLVLQAEPGYLDMLNGSGLAGVRLTSFRPRLRTNAEAREPLASSRLQPGLDSRGITESDQLGGLGGSLVRAERRLGAFGERECAG